MLRYEVEAENELDASKKVSSNLENIPYKQTDFELFVHPYVELKKVSENRNTSVNYFMHDFDEFK